MTEPLKQFWLFVLRIILRKTGSRFWHANAFST